MAGDPKTVDVPVPIDLEDVVETMALEIGHMAQRIHRLMAEKRALLAALAKATQGKRA